MAKVNTGTHIDDAPLVVALGPGFEAGRDCHAVVKTNRGHDLGRVIWQGPAEPDTKTPGEIGGYKGARVLRAPADGFLRANVAIGDWVREGHVIARIDGVPIVAPFDGMLRGIVHPTVPVHTGMKIGDLDGAGTPLLFYDFGQVAGDCRGSVGGYSYLAYGVRKAESVLVRLTERVGGNIMAFEWA